MREQSPQDPLSDLIRACTEVRCPDICPELRLRLGDLTTTWEALQRDTVRRSVAPPYWVVAWPGGRALARYVLDHAQQFSGRAVLDLGAGSGICAIAAALAGASKVAAIDTDPVARTVIPMNAALNSVRVNCMEAITASFETHWDVVLAADVWYERFTSQHLTTWLQACSNDGSDVLLGDSGRAFFPRRLVTALSRYRVASEETLERSSLAEVSVWTLRPNDRSVRRVMTSAIDA